MRGLGRIGVVRKDPFYLDCLSLNGERERDRLFCRHDYRHMVLVSQISCKVIKQTGGLNILVKTEGLSGIRSALEVVYAAGLLHDMGRWRQYDTGEDHALAGSVMAGSVLERAGFSKREAGVITRAIREHRKALPGQSYLGRVLCLADDLSRPCGSCGARLDCYKYEYMENIKKETLQGMRWMPVRR
ncbi:MAG: HD domain-containing protein [Actinobacteria bacterium]|nr:HD domain-containing protein [Actinomycetota bacterium]